MKTGSRGRSVSTAPGPGARAATLASAASKGAPSACSRRHATADTSAATLANPPAASGAHASTHSVTSAPSCGDADSSAP
jgi:hypothetical protein